MSIFLVTFVFENKRKKNLWESHEAFFLEISWGFLYEGGFIIQPWWKLRSVESSGWKEENRKST